VLQPIKKVMKLPSLNHVISNTGKTILRFPFETLCAIVATTCAYLLIEETGHKEIISKIALCSSLGLVVFLSSSLFFDTSKRWAYKRFFIQPVLLLLLGGYYFTFSYEPKEIEVIHFFVLNISFHFAVSFAAFINNGFVVEEFWEFNKRLFIRILTAGLYSAVLFGGLTLAIVALDKLFKLNIRSETYGHLFFTISGIFNTIFFLAGVPKLSSEKLETEYPNGLKAFTQFVLLPLVSLYLVILITYESKILITMSLPFGWVSNLILVYAIFGMLSFLLVYPISHLEDNKWMKTFNKWFYYFLVPLLGLLYWAIIYRLSKYGFTPERYYVLVLALWLTFIVSYFLITKSQNLKLIPMSLCITGLLTVYGPQSAQYVSKTSQLNRYTSYLEQNAQHPLTKAEQKEMSSVVDYLVENYGSKLLVDNSQTKLDSLNNADTTYLESKDIMNALSLKYYSRWSNIDIDDDTLEFNVWLPEFLAEQVSGYDFILPFSSDNSFKCDTCLQLKGANFPIDLTTTDNTIKLIVNGKLITTNIDSFVSRLKPNYQVEGEEYTKADLSQMIETNDYRIKLVYQGFEGKIENEKHHVTDFRGKIYIGVR
jgi:hypothetical protein